MKLPRRPLWFQIDPSALSVWTLVGAIVLYMAIDGGGYDVVVHSQVGILVWWVILLGAVVGLRPADRLSARAWVALGLFGGFVAWTGLATTWSLSSERSLQDLSLVACYLGVLVLGLAIQRDGARVMRHTMAALATAIVIVACLALASRLRPTLFPAAEQTAFFLVGSHGRLGWPLNYWNALAALLALGLPLLLALATSSRGLTAQALAAAAIPVTVLCGYLTFSRGGAVAGAVGVIAFLALAPGRIPKLATALVTAAGSSALIAAAVHRSAIERGLSGATTRREGGSLLVLLILVCAAVALTQVAIGLVARRRNLSRQLTIPRRRALELLLATLACCVVVALVAGAPAQIAHAWRDFQRPSVAALHENSLQRFTTDSSNGRYEYWKAALNATGGHLLGGSGPGTFQLLWLPRASYYSYVENAHSLYFETLAEVGVVGLVLLVGFLGLVVGSALRLVRRSRDEDRVGCAGVSAALVVFIVCAAYDWVWQVPALPGAFLLLAAAVLGPARVAAMSDRRSRESAQPGVWRLRLIRLGTAGLALAALLAIAVPLATTNAERASQAAVAARAPGLALREARAATRIEPDAASAQIQLALVLELRGEIPAALSAVDRATNDEPANWSAWLTASRIDAEAGHAAAALQAYRRARALNPRSPLFAL